MESIAGKIGCTAETARKWVRHAERDQGLRAGLTTDERDRLKALEREKGQRQWDPEDGFGFFRPGGARPSTEEMIAYIDDHKDRYGVEPICKVLPIAASVHYEHRARRADPARCPPLVRRDMALFPEIGRVHRENFGAYGARKVWLQLVRKVTAIARCTIKRLMRLQGLQGIRRGKRIWTIPDEAAQRPRDLVERKFAADWPNQLWVVDFTYVSTWTGFVFVAFVIDVFSCRIAGWRVARSMTTDLVLDALEQAIWARKMPTGLIHHSDRGGQYLSIR